MSNREVRVLHTSGEQRQAREVKAQRIRRARRRRRLRRTIAVLALLAVALLGFDVARSSEPSRRTQQAALSPVRPPSRPARPARPVYARTLDRLQVNPRLRLGLRAGLLFDVRSGRVLWQKAPDRPLPIASLTKMMTALVVIAHSSAHDHVLITRQAIDFSGSGVGLLPRGHRVPEMALLYGLLLPSGNDAAVALAQHVAGTQWRFVAMMNAQARAMHLTCTRFSNVSGLTDAGNHSCARDLAVLAHAVLSRPLLRSIVATRSAILPFPIKAGKLYLYSNNPLLLARYPGADGVKTGFTTASGLCLVATARRGHRWLGVVLLHSGNWLTQGITLLNAGFRAKAPRLTSGSSSRRAVLTRSTAG